MGELREKPGGTFLLGRLTQGDCTVGGEYSRHLDQSIERAWLTPAPLDMNEVRE